jgi:hypothetical protein
MKEFIILFRRGYAWENRCTKEIAMQTRILLLGDQKSVERGPLV